jgi:hypothetical protein
MEEDLIQILEMLVAVAVAIIAYWQRRQKIDAEQESSQVIAFFDPKDDSVTTPPPTVPARSWKMQDETRKWVLAGHDATNQGELLRQIEAAERQQLLHYFLTFNDRGGGFYEIEYGLMKGSGTGEPG